MKLIINEREISNYLLSLLDHQSECEKVTYDENNLSEAIVWSLEKKGENRYVPQKFVEKAKEKIKSGISRDLDAYVKKIQQIIEYRNLKHYNVINSNLEKIIDKIGQEKILSNYSIDPRSTGFVKGLGQFISDCPSYIRRKDYTNYQEDCLFRNMEGNESMLLAKMQNNWPFWFIDTGYSNFLSGKGKKWHRVVRNNLHHSTLLDVPADRLKNFEIFPQPWRQSGEKILIIEPGQFCAKTFGIDISDWKKKTILELQKYTDKKIVIREKLSKKTRKNLFKELCDEDYYCVVNINSNAAVEAIWAGVPVITLQKHISNPVTKNKISDINDLYRGSIGDWLCCLSYSQFTYDEIVDGTAYKIIKTYHE